MTVTVGLRRALPITIVKLWIWLKRLRFVAILPAKFVFLTIDGLNDHYKRTFHCDTPSQGYKGSSRLRQVGIQLSVVINLSIFLSTKYTQSKVADSSHSPEPFLYKCEPCNQVFLFKIPSLLNVRLQFKFSILKTYRLQCLMESDIYLLWIPEYQLEAFPLGASTLATSLQWILQGSI